MKDTFVQQFSQNIKFKYHCFDRFILRGCIRWLCYDQRVRRDSPIIAAGKDQPRLRKEATEPNPFQ